jgi:hypothetical protein
MKTSQFAFSLSLALALVSSQLSRAGTLDDAPFKIIVPSTEWQINDSTAQPMGNDVSIVATISNTNTLLKSLVIKTVLTKASASPLDDLCAGINDTFSNPAVTKLSEAKTTFLGYPARTFAYQVTQGGQTTYNVAIIFVADGKGWTIAFVGRPDQKDEIKTAVKFYQKKTG